MLLCIKHYWITIVLLFSKPQVVSTSPIRIAFMKTIKSKLHEVSAVYKFNTSIHNAELSCSIDVNDFVVRAYPVMINKKESVIAMCLYEPEYNYGQWYYQLRQ